MFYYKIRRMYKDVWSPAKIIITVKYLKDNDGEIIHNMLDNRFMLKIHMWKIWQEVKHKNPVP